MAMNIKKERRIDMKKAKRLVEFGIILFCAGVLFGCAADIRMAPRSEEPYPPSGRAPTRVGPFFVEDLDTIPDPVIPGQAVRFRTRLRNDGPPVRANLWIKDRDQVVGQLNDVFLPSGVLDFYFPFAQYQFERFDHCFTVVVDVERTPRRVDGARQFCAKPKAWTLRP